MDIIIFNQLQILQWHRTTPFCQASLPPSNSNSIISMLALKNKKPIETSTILNQPNTYCPDKNNLLNPHPSPKHSSLLHTTTSTPRMHPKLLNFISLTGSDSIGTSSGSMDTSKSQSYKVTLKMPEKEKSKSSFILKTTLFP